MINTAGQALYDHAAPLLEDDEQHGWAGLYLCAAIGAMLQDADQVVSDDDTYPGWARAMDPAVCPAAWLPWLAWVYGVTLVPNSSEQQQRDTITNLPPHQRGTRASLIAAAQQHLTGNKLVDFIERDGDAWQLAVVTRTSETPSTALVLAALLEQKPAGIILTYTATDSQPWDATVDTWDSTGTTTWDQTLTSDI